MDLSYCTNVHPAEDLDGVLEPARRVRRAGARAPPASTELGVGPLAARRPRRTARGERRRRARLRDRLDANGLELRTINAFPYRAFHAEVVKLDVYRPDWTDPRRAAVHARLRTRARRPPARGRDRQHLDAAARLARPVDRPTTTCGDRRARARLAPSCARCATRPAAPSASRSNPSPAACSTRSTTWSDGSAARRLGPTALGRIDPEFVGICLDTCHLAVSFADPGRRAADRRRRHPGREGAGLGGPARRATRPSRRAARRSPRSSSRGTCTRPVRSRPTASCCAPTTCPRRSTTLPDRRPVARALPRAAAPRARGADVVDDRRAAARRRRRARAPPWRRGPPRRRDLHVDRAARRRRRPRRGHRRRAPMGASSCSATPTRAGARASVLASRRWPS